MEILGLLLVFAVVLGLCYYTTKLLGKKFSGGAKNKSMKIVETLPLGLDRSLFLILVGKKHFLFLSSKKGLEMVSEIEMPEQTEEAASEETPSTNIFDFKRIFESYAGLSQKKTSSQSSQNDENAESKPTGILGSIKRLQKLSEKQGMN
ncbi:MAG: flagellar biosynthetic protein FliO [Clostridia bacterium]|nr:flagellar biosynthetic protein FliO [Clostridia bacterium]